MCCILDHTQCCGPFILCMPVQNDDNKEWNNSSFMYGSLLRSGNIEWTNLGTPQRICTSSLNLLQSIKITSSQSFSSFSTGHLKSLLVHVLYINLFNLQLYLICCILDHPLPQVKLQPHPICICPETKPDDNRNRVQRMKCN